MTTLATTSARRAARPFRWFGLAQFVALSRQRNHLSKLDKHMLDDIGLTETDAATESGRPFWDVPTKWRA